MDAADLRLVHDQIRQELRKFSAAIDRTEPNPNRLWTRKDVAAYLQCSYPEAKKWIQRHNVPLANAPGNKYLPQHVMDAAEAEEAGE